MFWPTVTSQKTVRWEHGMFPWVAEQFCAASFRKLPVKPHGNGLSGRQVIYDIDTCCPLAAECWSSFFVCTTIRLQTFYSVVLFFSILLKYCLEWNLRLVRIYYIDNCFPLAADTWRSFFVEPNSFTGYVLDFFKDWKFGKCQNRKTLGF